MITLYLRRHLFRTDRERHDFSPGMTISEMLEIAGGVRSTQRPYVTVNGAPVPTTVTPAAGDIVNCRLLPKSWFAGMFAPQPAAAGGITLGNSSRSSSSAAPLIGGSVLASNSRAPAYTPLPPVGNPLQPLLGLGLGIGAIGLLFSGLFGDRSSESSILNLLAPPPPELEVPYQFDLPITSLVGSYSSGGYQDKIKPRLTGVSNRRNDWGPVPMVLGTYKMFPVVSATAFPITKGDKITLSVGYDFGLGPLEITDLKIGDKDIDTIEEVEYELQKGEDGDPDITLYPHDAQIKVIEKKQEQNVAIIQRVPQEADEVVVDIVFDAGLYSVSGYDRGGAGADFKIEYRKVGDEDWTLETSAWNVYDPGSASAFRDTYEFELPERGIYDVRITRLTEVWDDSAYLVNGSKWSSLTGILYEPPYSDVLGPRGDTARFARLVLTAESSDDLDGSLEQVSAIVSSKVYTWDKELQSLSAEPVVSSNPGWLAIHVLRYGSMRPVPDARIDFDTFADWAQWCLDNNRTFNAIIDSTQPIKKVLAAIASAGRARICRRNGKVSVTWDTSKTEIIQHFTPENTWGFRFMTRCARKLHGLKTNFIDTDDEYQQGQRVAFNDGYGPENATLYEVLDLFGCTDKDQAYRDGRYQLAVSEFRSKTYELMTNWQYMVCELGDRVVVSNDVALLGLASGYIRSVTVDGGSGDVTAIEATEGFIFEEGKSYCLRIRRSNLQTLLIPLEDEVPGIYTTVRPAEPVPAETDPLPAAGDLVLFGEYIGGSGRESVPMIVVAIEPQPDHNARIILQEYREEVYLAETEDIPDYTSLSSVRHPYKETVAVPIVNSVISDERVLKKLPGNILVSQMQLRMALPPANVKFFEVRYRRTGAVSWLTQQPTLAATGVVLISAVEDGIEYEFQVRARSRASVLSEWSAVMTETVIGKTSKPPDPKIAVVLADGKTLHIPYNASVGIDVPLDYAGLQIRMNWGNNESWDQAVILSQLTKSPNFDVGGFTRGTKTFLVKAVDITGRMSESAAVYRKDFGDIIVSNELEKYNYHPTFPGNITGGAIEEGEIRANDDGSLMWTGSNSDPFWAQGEDEVLQWGDSYEELEYEFTFKAQEAIPNGSILKILVPGLVADNFKIEYKLPDQAPFWTGDNADLFWQGDDEDLFYGVEEGSWSPMPTDGIPLSTGELVRLRIVCYASLNRPRIPAVTAVVDVPDKVAYINDAVIPIGGTRVPPPSNFALGVLKNVSIDLQYDVANYPDAKRAAYYDKDPALGPYVVVFDADDNPVAGLVDLTLQGYGP